MPSPSRSYDRQVQFQRAAVRDTGMQRVKDQWAAFGPPVPARMLPGVGSERFQTAQAAADAPAVYWFRYHPELAGLSPADRLMDDGRAFDVKAVRWDGRTNSEVEVACVRAGGAL